ncbi:MAG: hypothetical protein J6T74_05850 [Clostridia bacterium]|nr:hypothetical protein [Clostridia bacterium]MBO7712068.1 hypothetical protein [Methanobrevibacter sp.]MBO7712141.1 hypothetical protein [Methanobrevibacter sp.]
MTPYEEYENQLKEQEHKFKKQQKEKIKRERKLAQDKRKLIRKNNAEIIKAMRQNKRDREVVKNEHKACVQLDIQKAMKEYNERRKMDFENISLVNLLHKPK